MTMRCVDAMLDSFEGNMRGICRHVRSQVFWKVTPCRVLIFIDVLE